MARALARRGHQVTVVCYGHGHGEADSDYRVVRTPRVPGYRNMRAGPDWVKPMLDLALAAKIASVPADVVHAHNYEAPLAALAARLRMRAPLVYSAHNTMREELPSYFSGRAVKGAARGLGALLDRTVPRSADHAVVLSEAARQTLQGLGCRRVSLVPPGVDFDELRDVEPVTVPGGPWVVYAGNPDAYQDLDILVEAVRALDGVGLLMVSAAPLDEWAAKGLPRFKAIQTSDFSVVKSLVAGAEVAAIPRTVCSGFPIKLLNNLGLGTPTVVARGSSRGLPGEVVVDNGDVKAMATAIRVLIDSPTRRRQLGKAGLAHVRDACSWEARAMDLEKIYAACLEV